MAVTKLKKTAYLRGLISNCNQGWEIYTDKPRKTLVLYLLDIL
jgi:hypothetical protein